MRTLILDNVYHMLCLEWISTMEKHMFNRWKLSFLALLLGGAFFSTGCSTVPPCSSMDSLQMSKMPDSDQDTLPSVHSTPSSTLALERKVKLQEKRIAELSAQLRLLKRIDLDRNK